MFSGTKPPGTAIDAVALLDVLPDALVQFDRERRVVFSNAAAARFVENGDLALFEFPSQVRVTSGRLIREASDSVARGQEGAEYYLWRGGSEAPCWVTCKALPLLGADGKTAGTVVAIRDITERKKRDLARQSSDRLHDTIYRGNLAGIIHTAVDGTILDCNDAIVRMLGYSSREELRSVRSQHLYYDPEDRGKLLRLLDAPDRTGEFEICLRRRDASRCWVFAKVCVLDPGPGESGATFVTTVIEITDLKKAEQARLRNEERFSAFMRYLPGIAFIKDVEGRYVYYNDALRRVYGIEPERFMGKTDAEVWPAEEAELFRSSDKKVIETMQPQEFMEAVTHDNGAHTWLVYKFPIFENGVVMLVGGVGIDITERLTLEDQLTQSRKIEALGRLAGGVAHDFNNLLTVISGYCQLALEAVGNAPATKMAGWLQEILNSSKRAAGLTAQLLAFSRRQPVVARVVDLADLLHEMDDLLQRMMGELVDLRIHCGTIEPCLVNADPHQMEQVVINLAVNARDAMLLGGTLDIECRIVERALGAGRGPRKVVLLEVRDTGIGMDEKVKAQMFEPFFTSKATGKGTGLGLSTVYGVISQGGGEIEVDSQPGEGSTFRIYLPLASGAVEALATRAKPPVGTETVLLVEDEGSLNALAQTILRKLGYTVVAAENGQEALALWDSNLGKFDLLLTDVIMPLMGGGELAHKLREKVPGLKVLFMSGYTDDMIASHGVMARETQFLQKPFTAETLARKVRDVLDA